MYIEGPSVSEKYPFIFENIRENLKLLKDGVVSFDIDAVTQKTYLLALNRASHTLKKNISVDQITKYWALRDIALSSGKSEAESTGIARRAWNDHDVYLNSPAMPGITYLLKMFNEIKIPYMFISSRPMEFSVTTKRWFKKNLPWVNPATIIVQRPDSVLGGVYKAGMINKYGVSLHIEDALEEAKTIVEQTSAKVIIVPQPWNEHNQFLHPNIKYLGKFAFDSGTFPLIRFLAKPEAKNFLDHVAHY